MQFAQRLQALQTNVFADMDRAKAQALAAGRSLIDLSLGSSDLPTSELVLETIASALQDPNTHGYALFQSTQPFRVAAAAAYQNRYGIPVDPETEVLPLIGSQEGTAHLPLAVLNPGDYALLQDPGYPSHYGGVALAGGRVQTMPLRAEANFLPVWSEIPKAVLAQAKLMVLSYPHNPTTAIAPLEFFQEAVAFCQRHELVLAHDFPYADLVFTGTATPPSIFAADRDKRCSIEFFTFSKSFNMGGFRIGYAIGNAQLIKALRQVKAVIDFNQYRGILQGAIAALEAGAAIVQPTVAAFEARRDVFVDALHQMGWLVPRPVATMYVWAPLPATWDGDDIEFCTQLVAQTGVALAPGSGFGPAGTGYVRFALVHEPPVLLEAVRRIQEFIASC
ncbi:MAG: LL-diaminopimelate aminotransferase [Spirulina sp. SIO3F2]|nr:LL-diaminopimelate aminotransferase [Spirulina sp. SIO3F2]